MFGRRATRTTRSARLTRLLALLGALAVGGVAAWSAMAASAPSAPVITSSPSSPTNATSATFAYAFSGATGFRCKLDTAASFTACASTGITYAGLTQGSHTFQVKATTKKADTSAASYTWVVDTTPPTVAPTITGGPAGLVNSADATFAFSGETGASFQCALESTASPAACASPASFTGLAQGSHTLYVRQVDAAGNVGTAFASRSWTVDTVPPPAPVIDTKPDDPNGDGIAKFDWTDEESPVTYRCSIENKPSTSCTSPVRTIVDVSNDGQHQFAVSAFDAAGNKSTTSYTWKVLKGVNVTVEGDAVGLLYPGGPARGIALTLHNPNNFPIVVSSITASVTSSPPGCAAAGGSGPPNIEIHQSNVGHGTSPETMTVFANGSLSLPSGPATAPTIRLVDTGLNQDACKNGSFGLSYVAIGGK